jgi:hypothetical protein
MDISQQDLALIIGQLHLQALDLQGKLAKALARIDELEASDTANSAQTPQ